MLRLPDREVDVGVLARIVRAYPVERFQIVATRSDLVRVLTLPGEELTDGHLTRLTDELRSELQPDVEVEVVRATSSEFVGAGRRKHVDFVDLT